MSIPKTVHYCWFGGKEKPELTNMCISSWKKHLPDYEIIEWNENNFDINMNNFVKEAYEAKKYAFVSDYVRMYVLDEYGGIYLDTDVEVIKPLDRFLTHDVFLGYETDELCGTGTIGAIKNHELIKNMLNYYEDKKFILGNGDQYKIPNPVTITEIIKNKFGWESSKIISELPSGIYIYPFEYFCAKNLATGEITVTENTYTIHHFSGSWLTWQDKLKKKIIGFIGPDATQKLVSIKHKVKNIE